MVVDLSGDVAFEAADGFFLGEAFVDASVDVVAGRLVGGRAADGDGPETPTGVNNCAIGCPCLMRSLRIGTPPPKMRPPQAPHLQCLNKAAWGPIGS